MRYYLRGFICVNSYGSTANLSNFSMTFPDSSCVTYTASTSDHMVIMHVAAPSFIYLPR